MNQSIKKIVLFNLIVFGLGIMGSSQSCLPEGIILRRQSQIDSFPISYPGCSEIEGYVHIYGYDVHNLQALSSLTSIGGDLNIETTNNLESLNGLNNLLQISGHLYIRSNHDLSNLEGLENLTTVLGDVWFYNNSLISLNGLTSLTFVGGTFTISQNPFLNNIQDMKHLNIIKGNLEIMGNDSFFNLQGLDSLKTVSGSIDIHYNLSLISLYGLSNLNFIGGNLNIYANYSLLLCAIESMCNYIANPTGSINIHDNATGCNSKEEILKTCDTLSGSEHPNLQRWRLFPNPAKNEFTISNTNEDQVTSVNIYNHLGHRVVNVIQFNGQIDISELPIGLYLVEFKVNGKSIQARLVKQ